MAAVKLEHLDLVKHQVGIVQQFREFWMENHLCDVVLKSTDGAEHRAHTALISATSMPFKKMLSGSFLEADHVQRGQPVEMAASKAAVSALLDYMYGGQPEVNLEAGLELLRLAEAYDLPKLAGAIEAAFRASLDSSDALRVLQEAHGLDDLKVACEEIVAKDFETCSQHPDFGKLSASQLARILKRSDLAVFREEAVLKCIFKWLSVSRDRSVFLGILLQHVDFHAVSIDNLLRLGRITLSGPDGGDLHREVTQALRVRQRRAHDSDEFQPKRRCLQHWSPDLGASSRALGREVLSVPCFSLCWHQGGLYATDYNGNILCWKPGDAAADARRVVGEGAAVTGINDLGYRCELAISPTGEIFVHDVQNHRLVSFENGSGRIVFDDFPCNNLFCSPTGVLYLLPVGGRVVQKLVGSSLQTVVAAETLPADLQFAAVGICVTKDEVIYVLDVDDDNDIHRILRINPAESLKPVVVGQVPSQQHPDLWNLFVTEAGTIYVLDQSERKVLAFRPGNTQAIEVLQCPDDMVPMALWLHNSSMYLSMDDSDQVDPPSRGGIYEYALPPELQLE